MISRIKISTLSACAKNESKTDEIIALQHEKGKPVVVISCSLPYDAAKLSAKNGRWRRNVSGH